VTGSNPTLGVVLCVAAALAYAGGATLQKPAVRDVPALEVTWIACLVGAVACLPFAPGLVAQLGTASPDGVAWLVYLGLFPTSIAFTTWAFALRHTSAGRLGATTYLIPPIVIALGWAVLGEVPSPVAVGGGALCIGGVVVARSTRWPWPAARRPATEGSA
jgi:drug/metabolite transporter (DMT)-like permease